MASTKKPVSVGGIEFSALMSSERKFESIIPEYTTETGFTITDAVILKNQQLSLVLYLSDTPVTWAGRQGVNNNYTSKAVSKLVTMYEKKTPVTVVTSEGTFKDMVIEQMTIGKSLENGFSREIPITFRKIRTTTSKKTTIPKAYGKSGATKSKTGGSGGSSGGGGGGGGGSSGGGSGDGGKKQSTLKKIFG